MSMIDNIAEYTPHVNKLREQTLTASQVSYMQDIENAEAFDDPEYKSLVTTLNRHFVCRHPENAPRQLVSTLATPVYNYFQGNNEFVMVGALNGWDQRANLHKIMTLLYSLLGNTTRCRYQLPGVCSELFQRHG